MQNDRILLLASLEGPPLENLEKWDGEEAWLVSANKLEKDKISMVKNKGRRRVCALLLCPPWEESIANMLNRERKTQNRE